MISTAETCDHGNCPANSEVTVTMPESGLDLVFCGHHYRANYDALVTAGAETYSASYWPKVENRLVDSPPDVPAPVECVACGNPIGAGGVAGLYCANCAKLPPPPDIYVN